MADHEKLAKALETSQFTAEMFSPDVVLWQNIGGGREESLADVQRNFAVVANIAESVTFEKVRTRITEASIIVERVIVIELKDGTTIRAPVLVVATVKDGLVVRLNEYLSESRMAALFTAMGAAG